MQISNWFLSEKIKAQRFKLQYRICLMILVCLVLSSCTSTESSFDVNKDNLKVSEPESLNWPSVRQIDFEVARDRVTTFKDKISGRENVIHSEFIPKIGEIAITDKGSYAMFAEAIIEQNDTLDWELHFQVSYFANNYIEHSKVIVATEEERLVINVDTKNRKQQSLSDSFKFAESSDNRLTKNEAITFCAVVKQDSATLTLDGASISYPSGPIPVFAMTTYRDICTVFYGLKMGFKL